MLSSIQIRLCANTGCYINRVCYCGHLSAALWVHTVISPGHIQLCTPGCPRICCGSDPHLRGNSPSASSLPLHFPMSVCHLNLISGPGSTLSIAFNAQTHAIDLQHCAACCFLHVPIRLRDTSQDSCYAIGWLFDGTFSPSKNGCHAISSCKFWNFQCIQRLLKLASDVC